MSEDCGALTLDDAPDPLKVEELARVLRCGRRQAYDLVNSGAVYGARIGTAIRIPKSAVRRFLEGAENENGEPPEPRLAVVEGGRATGRRPSAE